MSQNQCLPKRFNYFIYCSVLKIVEQERKELEGII